VGFPLVPSPWGEGQGEEVKIVLFLFILRPLAAEYLIIRHHSF